MKFRSLKLLATLVALPALSVAQPSRPLQPDISKINDGKTWSLSQATATAGADKSVKLTVTGDAGSGSRAGIAWVEGVDFNEGTIEVELKGRGAPPQGSFLGIAFHGQDAKTFEGVYFRPFNFKAPEPQKLRAVQYISWPEHTWEKLRKDQPNTFEKPVTPVPNPDDWFHAKIEVTAKQVRVFVEKNAEPSLVVTRLSSRQGGKVGLLTDVHFGEFRNLKITPR